jgi:hypothetical protein
MTVVMILGQLAIIRIKDLREHGATDDFLGYAPNLVAAATLPGLFVLLLLKRGVDAGSAYSWSSLWRETSVHVWALLITTGSLLAWEFVQVYRPNRTFDLQDVWATLVGAAVWIALVAAGRALTAGSHRRLVAASLVDTTVENTSP